jgi:hypothetical protein
MDGCWECCSGGGDDDEREGGKCGSGRGDNKDGDREIDDTVKPTDDGNSGKFSQKTDGGGWDR